MSAKTKILVIKMRELIYTALFLVFILLLAVLLIFMFFPASKKTSVSSAPSGQEQKLSDTAESAYIAGVYTTPITLGDSAVDVEVIVDENHINSIRLVNLSESTAAMYPLISPSLDDLAAQVCQKQSLEHIACPESNKYTSQILLNAIAQSLSNASQNSWQ